MRRTNNNQYLPTPTTVDQQLRSKQSFLPTLYIASGDGTCTGTGMPVSGMSRRCSELLKVKILNQLLNDRRIDLQLDSKERFVEIKPFRNDSKVPFKDLQIMMIHLYKIDADLLVKVKWSQPTLGLDFVNKNQIERMSSIVVIFTMVQFRYKTMMGLKDLVNKLRSFLNDFLNSSKYEGHIRECLVKISKNIRRIEDYLGMQKVECDDEFGGGNAVIEGKDGCNDGVVAAKKGNDNVEIGGENMAANRSLGIEEECNAANPSAETEEEGSSESD